MRRSRSSGFLKMKRTGNIVWEFWQACLRSAPSFHSCGFMEVGNGLVTACRRNRITTDQIEAFLIRLKALPIDAAPQTPAEILELPSVALLHGLTNYDASYLALAQRSAIPLATTDRTLRLAAVSAHVNVLAG